MRSGGAGLIAIETVMKEMFDLDSITRVPVHGRTDQGIMGDIFSAASQDYAQHQAAFTTRYVEQLAKTLKLTNGEVLPGVGELLEELASLNNVALGILTGNGMLAAEVKLRHFGLDKYFSFGGYGDLHAERNRVAELAKHSAQSFLGSDFDDEQVWVVGDTVNDITCARSINANVVAVETGGIDPSGLREADPDLQLADLTSAKFVETIMSGSRVAD